MKTLSCYEAWQEMTKLAKQGHIYHYHRQIDMSQYCVETELFPKPVLEAYSAWNLGLAVNDNQRLLFNNERGGGQGDYRQGMQEKIANVIDCLTYFPHSKRAIVTISNQPSAHHSNDTDAKCLREIHLYLDDNILNATVLFRAQAALIFPKNIHFIGELMAQVAASLPTKPCLGKIFYLTSILVSDRS